MDKDEPPIVIGENEAPVLEGLLGVNVISIARPLKPSEPICNFCGKPKSQVPYLVKGSSSPGICSICIYKCIKILAEEGIIVVQKEKT